MAPLPYLTGIVPHAISDEISINFLPPTNEAEAMSFMQRNRVGLKLGMQNGIDLFFGLSAVIAKISDIFASGSGSGDRINIFNSSLRMNYRLLKGMD